LAEVSFVLFPQLTRLTDRQTDRQTDERTDGFNVAKTALHTQRGKMD